MGAIKAGFAYFALVFGAGFMRGVLRVAFLMPRLGDRMAELGEMPLMLAVILVSARTSGFRGSSRRLTPWRRRSGGSGFAVQGLHLKSHQRAPLAAKLDADQMDRQPLGAVLVGVTLLLDLP